MSGTVTMVTGAIEYLRVPVSATVDGVTVNVGADAVKMAIRAAGATTALSWQTATWDTDTSTTPTTYLARCLIGQAPFALTVGVYQVYVKVSDNPETPILAAGQLYLQPG